MMDLLQRLMMLVGRGRIKVVNDAGPVQLVQIKLGDKETRDNTPRLAEYGLASNPPVDSDGVALFNSGDRSKGVVIATGHQLSRMKDLQRGESALYDDLGQFVYLTRAGIVVNGAGRPVTINNAPTVTINAATSVVLNTPLLTVNGDIVATGNISDQNGVKGVLQHIRDNYDSHTHSDPQGGSTGGPSNTL